MTNAGTRSPICTMLFAGCVGVVLIAGASKSLHAQGPASIESPDAAWRSNQVTHLIGLPESQPKTKGTLSLSSRQLVFTTPGGHLSIDRASILSVTVGDVRVETGGTAGRITRAIIPFGGGAAVATVTNKQIGLLTVQFRDRQDALHGAVFLLPKDEAVQAQQEFGSADMRVKVEQLRTLCQINTASASNTLMIDSVASSGEPIPAEYRVLLYEQLLKRLGEGNSFRSIYRDGDSTAAPGCPQYNLTLTLSAFNKGNAALRASTGPIGLFVGATSLKVDALVQYVSGHVLLNKQFKVSKRGDSDSLDVTDKITRSIAKALRKLNPSAVLT